MYNNYFNVSDYIFVLIFQPRVSNTHLINPSYFSDVTLTDAEVPSDLEVQTAVC